MLHVHEMVVAPDPSDLAELDLYVGPATLEDAVEAGSWLCGPPELIIEKISALQEMLPGLEELNMGLPVGTPQSVLLEQLQRFGEEVMPAFKRQVAAPAAV